MKRICHMTSVHKRYDGRILKKECVSLANAGYDVTLIVADNQDDEFYNGVKITSIDFHPKNRIDRIINSKRKMLKKALEINADIYHFHDPELIPLGLKLLKYDKKVIYDSHEDYPIDIKMKKRWIPFYIRHSVSCLFKWYEMMAAKKFNAVVSVSPEIVERFAQVNHTAVMITNYPIVTHNSGRTKEKGMRKIVCFAGTISSPWEHENIVRAINHRNDIEYVLAGPISDDFKDKLTRSGVGNNVKYLGSVSYENVEEIYAHSCVGNALLHTTSSLEYKKGGLGCTKIFEYMMYSLPIICSDLAQWSEIVNQWKCGIVVDPDNIDNIAQAIMYLCDNSAIATEMGKNGRKAIEKEYNWKTQEQCLLNLYENLSRNKALVAN